MLASAWAMNKQKQPLAGGIFVALGPVVGVLIGRRYGETSAGFLIGLAAGAAIAVALWLTTRR